MSKIIKIIPVLLILVLVSNMGIAQAQIKVEPEIVRFETGAAAVSRERLETGEQLVPVTWEVVNRPVSTTLVFDQLLPNGTLVNVELPREWDWVNSADSGVVAPVDPGEEETIVYLVLRVVDAETDFMLDYQVRELPIVTETEYLALIETETPEPVATPMNATAVPTAAATATIIPQVQSTNISGPVQILDFHIYNEFPAFEDTVMLMWQVVNATEVWIGDERYPAYDLPCCASGDYNGGVTLPVSELVSGPGEWTIKMEARGADGSIAASAFLLTVHSGPLPSQPNAQILSFEASAQTVNLSGSVTLSWSTRDADTLSISSSRGEGIIKIVPITDPQPNGSITLPVTQLVNEPDTYWISLEANSNRPGWAGSGYSIALTVIDG